MITQSSINCCKAFGQWRYMPAQGGFREEASHNTGRERPTANKNKCRTGEMGPCDYDRGQRVSLYLQSQKMKRSKAAARC